MKNLNIQFIDEHDNDVTFDVLANNSQVDIVEIRVPDLSISRATMSRYIMTIHTLLLHYQIGPIDNLLSWLIDSWDEKDERGVVHRYIYDHLADCYCGVLED